MGTLARSVDVLCAEGLYKDFHIEASVTPLSGRAEGAYDQVGREGQRRVNLVSLVWKTRE